MAMIKPRHYRNYLPALALAIVCTPGTTHAQNYVPASGVALPAIEGKQAEKMAIAHGRLEYPPVALVNYIEGLVQLELTVNEKGNVEKAHVVKGNAILAESVLRAARGWTYHPLITPSGPSGFCTVVTLRFTLQIRWEELTPQQAEEDFMRQVKPPEAVHPPEDAHPADLVHMRLLLNDQGRIVDWGGMPRNKAQSDAAFETLRGWTFHPAHWGNLPVATYLDVDVPLGAASIARTAANYVVR